MLYYLDTCIWLNLFKKEGDSTKGKPYWIIAEEFIDNVRKNDGNIVVSTIVIKELTFKLDNINKALKFFKENSDFISLVKTSSDDYDIARKIEYKNNFKIGFYDCLHIALAKRLNSILITRDRDLIDIAKEYVLVNRPEELIN